MKTTNPDQDETETRLRKIEGCETRPRRDCLKNFHPRRDNLQNFVRDRDETESLGTFGLETEMRLRLSPISGIMRGKNGQSVLDLVNVITKSKEMHPKFAGKFLIGGFS